MPKQNRIPISYDTFQRVDEDTSIEKIGNGTIATLDDMVLNNPYGSASIRGGYQLQKNDQATNAISRIINVKDIDNVEFLVAGNGSLISKATTGAWSNIKTGLTGTGNFQFTQIPKGLVFTNGSDKPFILSGSSFGTDNNVEIEPPDVRAITAQRTTDGTGNLRGTSAYRWILVYKTEVGELSNVSAPFAYVHSVAGYGQQTSGVERRFIFRELPVSTDSRVTHKILYRTEGYVNNGTDAEKTTGLIYYKVVDLQNSITIFVDDIADTDLDFGDVITFIRLPNKAEYTIRSNNRLWFANYELPKISQNRPPYACIPHGSSNEYPIGSGQNWDDSAQVTVNLQKTTDIQSSPDTTGLTPEYFYQYMYTYVNHNDIESRPSYGGLLQTDVGGSFRTITTALYDAGRVGANNAGLKSQSVKARRIYRTLGEDSSFTVGTKPFYLVVEQLIDQDTGGASKINPAFIDDNTDDSSTLYAEAVEPQVSAIAWSKVDRPAYFAVEDVKQIFAEETDDITGFLDDGNGVMIWKENSIIKLYHTGAPNNWYLRKVWNEYGCDNPLSLIKLGDTYYFSFRNKIYSMISGQAPTDISYGRYASFTGMTILNVVGNDQWVIYTTTEGSNHYQMIYDRVVRTWYKFNFSTYDLTCSFVKKYDSIWTGFQNTPFAIVLKRMYDYDITTTEDLFSAQSEEVDPSITFPLFKIKGTPSKLRNIVIDWVKTGQSTLKLTLTTDAGTTVANVTGLVSGLQRVNSALNGLPASNNFKLKISGNISQLNDIRLDFRPVRQGIGV